MTQPLQGIRVIDLARVLGAPLCCQILGDLGAEVIKVESPRGDMSRGDRWSHGGVSLDYANYNRNKFGASLNLRTDRGKDLLRELVACSDVLVQNYRIGVMEEMGLGYAELSKINPRLVMLSISGFGRRSSLRNWPGLDGILQAMSGMMDLTGPPDGPPMLVGTYIADHLAGMWGALGVLAALEYRSRTGEGQEVDIGLLPSTIAVLGITIPWFLLTGETRPRSGNTNPLHAAVGAFPTKDGHVFVDAGGGKSWPNLVEVIGRAELQALAHTTSEERLERKDEIDALVAEWTALHTSQELTDILAEAGVVVGPVRTIQDVAADPELRGLEMILDVQTPDGSAMPVMGNPIKLAKAPIRVRQSPPQIGQDNEHVYRKLLGHTPDELRAWRENGVI